LEVFACALRPLSKALCCVGKRTRRGAHVAKRWLRRGSNAPCPQFWLRQTSCLLSTRWYWQLIPWWNGRIKWRLTKTLGCNHGLHPFSGNGGQPSRGFRHTERPGNGCPYNHVCQLLDALRFVGVCPPPIGCWRRRRSLRTRPHLTLLGYGCLWRLLLLFFRYRRNLGRYLFRLLDRHLRRHLLRLLRYQRFFRLPRLWPSLFASGWYRHFFSLPSHT